MSTVLQTDLYAALGVAASADAAQIKGAYRLLVRQFHPDANPDKRAQAEARIKELTQAYAILGDPQKRAQYDRDVRLSRFEAQTPIAHRALLTRVRVALGLSASACAERLGMTPAIFSDLEARDALPSLPVQSRTFVMLLDAATRELEKHGETGAARELRQDLARRRASQAALR
jgi:curved DNA-binding protein CbpA